jgi:hypothetical protein
MLSLVFLEGRVWIVAFPVLTVQGYALTRSSYMYADEKDEDTAIPEPIARNAMYPYSLAYLVQHIRWPRTVSWEGLLSVLYVLN